MVGAKLVQRKTKITWSDANKIDRIRGNRL